MGGQWQVDIGTGCGESEGTRDLALAPSPVKGRFRSPRGASDGWSVVLSKGPGLLVASPQ